MTGNAVLIKDRINEYITAIERLQQGQFEIDVPLLPVDQVSRLGQSLYALARTLETQHQDMMRLSSITTNINAGLFLNDVLDKVYEEFRAFILPNPC